MEYNKNKIAVVLMSGGMDSALCAAYAKRDGYQIAALHTNYGQRTETKELQAFNSICDYYNVEKKLIVNIDFLKQIGGSSLTDTAIEVENANLDSTGIPKTYVPFRNANLLGIATAWAETIGAEAIYIGAVESDSSGYPDCRESFYSAYQNAINEGVKPETKIIIKTPIITFTKKDIVLKSIELGSPLHLTWSCYKSEDLACGVCDSCALRLRGFSSAGIKDPIQYTGELNEKES